MQQRVRSALAVHLGAPYDCETVSGVKVRGRAVLFINIQKHARVVLPGEIQKRPAYASTMENRIHKQHIHLNGRHMRQAQPAQSLFRFRTYS